MESEKAEEEDAAPQHYVASYNFIASGSDQVRDKHRNRKKMKDLQDHRKFSLLSAFCVKQLSFTSGDALLVHAKPSPEWWWAELRGVIGYVPATYLRQSGDGEEEDDPSAEDPWQDEEYFGSYSTLVRSIRASPKSTLWSTNHRFSTFLLIFEIVIVSVTSETLLKALLRCWLIFAEASPGNVV